MNKATIILNDYASNLKTFVAYEEEDITQATAIWDRRDQRLVNLHVLPEFLGYEKWSELSPAHFRLLISQGLKKLAQLTPEERTNTKLEAVSTTNLLILLFIICVEKQTGSTIEHFRINRFDDTAVTFDYSATFEIEYDRPLPKTVLLEPEPTGPAFSIVIDNSDEPR
jgi:hypothetical protein